ncbi:MAG: GNAT family N-acetyltransferase [Planctomycetes bacterium]|nr:GNAT family N-acetyltransferase [Planctomycetota bacterium]
MELPIAKQSYLPTADALVRAIKRSATILARTLTEEVALDSATVFADPGRAGVSLAALAMDVRIPEGATAESAVGEVMEAFTRVGVECQSLDSADHEWPAGMAAALEPRGYHPVTHSVYLLDQYKPPTRTNDQIQIIPARSMYPALREHLAVQARAEYGADDVTTPRYVQAFIDYLDESRLDLFVGRLEGKIVGSIGVVTLGNMGVIYPAFTDPAARGKGVAGTLAHYLMDHCSRAQFERVLLDRVAGCPAIPFYESLGFKPIASYVRYDRAGGH